MGAVITLVAHSLRRIRTMLIVLAALLAGFEFMLTQVASYLIRRGAFGQLALLMPDFVRSLLGPSSLAFMSFTGIVAFGYFHPMVIAAVVWLSILIATEPAGEVETRFVDLTLARELTRADVIVRTVVVFFVAVGFVLGMMMLGTSVGLACCTPADAPHTPPKLIVSLAFSLGCVMVCWAGIALGVAAAARRRSVAAGAVGILALTAYLLDYIGRVWDPARTISSISPFHYFDPTALVAGQPLSVSNAVVLVGAGIAGAVVGAVVFSKRDI